MSSIGGVGFQATTIASAPFLENDLDAGGHNISSVNKLSATTVSATTVNGTVNGTLNGTLNGTFVPTGPLNMNSNNVLGVETLTANNVYGTLRTPLQPYITSLGTQTVALKMGGFNIQNAGDVATTTLTAGNVTVTGNTISAITGTGHVNLTKNLDMNSHSLLNVANLNGNAVPANALVDVSSTQTLTNKTIGNMQFATNTINGALNQNLSISPSGSGVFKVTKNLDMVNNNIVAVGTITATTLAGTLSTAAQPNITSLGALAADIDMGGFDITRAANLKTLTGGFTIAGELFTSALPAPNLDISLNPHGSGVVKIQKTLNMMSNAITSCTSLNSQTIPSSSIVGINDIQTFTNKTIDASQLVNSSVTSAKIGTGAVLLSKIESIGTQTFLGNSSNLTSLYPEAMSVGVAKNLLGLAGTNNGDQNLIGDVTSAGSTTLTTTISNGAVSLAKMATLAANSIIGNNTGSAATPLALSTAQVKSLLSLDQVQNQALSSWTGSSNITTIGTQTTIRTSNITSPGNLAITPNSGVSNVEIWGPLDMKTNSISNVNEFTCSGPMSNGGTYSNFVTSRTLNTNLTLNAQGTGIPVTNNASFWVSSTVANVDSTFNINGPTVNNSRYIGCFQNGTYKLSFGLSASSHFFIYDGVNSRDLFHASILNANIRLPTYTTNGTLSVTAGNGTVTSSSDRRLKQGEVLLSPVDSLNRVLALRPKKYSWKADTSNRVNIGFVAQDVEQAIPEAVDGKKFEYEFVRDGASQGVEGTVRVDDEGKPVLDQDKPRYRGLDQCAILSVVVSAVQELARQNAVLESRIVELEDYIRDYMPNKIQRV